MLLQRTFITVLFSAIGLAGCANMGGAPGVSQYKTQFEKDPPSTEWLEKETQTLREKAWSEPTQHNIEIFAFVKSEFDKRQEQEQREGNWDAQTHRMLTVDWGNEGRGGAAFRQPAYIHVLADGAPTFTDLHHPIPLRGTESMISSSLDKLPRLKGGSYSMYELSRWERYCNGGKGMDKRDWAFVRKEGIANVPTALIGKCNPPTTTHYSKN